MTGKYLPGKTSLLLLAAAIKGEISFVGFRNTSRQTWGVVPHISQILMPPDRKETLELGFVWTKCTLT